MNDIKFTDINSSSKGKWHENWSSDNPTLLTWILLILLGGNRCRILLYNVGLQLRIT